MPALAPLLAHRRVLGAADRRHGEVAGDADVAADAFADVLRTPLLDLPGEERIGDRRTRAADQIDQALPDDRHHSIGRRVPPDRDHRLRGQALDAFDEGLVSALGSEARGHRIVLPARQDQIPQIGKLGEKSDRVLGLRLLEPVRPEQLVHGNPAGNRAGIAHCLAGVDQHLLEETDAVLERPAVLVGALVVPAGKEVVQKGQGMSGVDVDQVEPGTTGAQRRRPVPAPKVPDVALVHRTRLDRIVGVRHDRQGGRRHRHLAAVGIRGVHSVVGELDSRERPEFVNPVRHARQHRDIAVVPQPQLDERGDVRGMVKLDLLGAHHRPAALRLHPAHPRERGGIAVAHAVAVRDLVEAVLRGHRADGDRLEQDVVPWITSRVAGHCRPPAPIRIPGGRNRRRARTLR